MKYNRNSKPTHRTKELTEVQELRLENRNLKGEVKSLKKKLKRLERKEHSFEQSQYNEIEEQQEVPHRQEKCPDCARGTLEEISVVGRFFKRCNICDYRSKTVKIPL